MKIIYSDFHSINTSRFKEIYYKNNNIEDFYIKTLHMKLQLIIKLFLVRGEKMGQQKRRLKDCSICGCKLNPKNYERHISKVHSNDPEKQDKENFEKHKIL